MRHEELLPCLLSECCSPEAESAHPAPTEVFRNSKGLCSLCKGACAVVAYTAHPKSQPSFERGVFSLHPDPPFPLMFVHKIHPFTHKFQIVSRQCLSSSSWQSHLGAKDGRHSQFTVAPMPLLSHAAEPWSCTPSHPSCRRQAHPGACTALPCVTFLGPAW